MILNLKPLVNKKNILSFHCIVILPISWPVSRTTQKLTKKCLSHTTEQVKQLTLGFGPIDQLSAYEDIVKFSQWDVMVWIF